jgi:hypothetical protein
MKTSQDFMRGWKNTHRAFASPAQNAHTFTSALSLQTHMRYFTPERVADVSGGTMHNWENQKHINMFHDLTRLSSYFHPPLQFHS